VEENSYILEAINKAIILGNISQFNDDLRNPNSNIN
jgi:hypothetical protein